MLLVSWWKDGIKTYRKLYSWFLQEQCWNFNQHFISNVWLFCLRSCSSETLCKLVSYSDWSSWLEYKKNTKKQLEGHSAERMYLRQRSSHGSRWIKPFYNLASLQRRAPNTYTWDFPDVIKLFVAAHKISEKAIRFRHPDYNPDGAQKLISSSMCRHMLSRNISSKSMHAFLSNLANRQTDKRIPAKTFISSFARGN